MIMESVRKMKVKEQEAFDIGYLNGYEQGRRDAVEAAPVRRGEWVAEFDLDDSTFYRCSICGRQEVLLTKEDIKEYFPYCHCGAKMGGKHD